MKNSYYIREVGFTFINCKK